MGGEPWKVSAPFDADVARVLDEARRRIFREGRYTGVEGHHFATLEELDAFFTGPSFCLAPDEKANEEEGWRTLDMSGSTGTQSILDIRKVGSRIAWGVAAPLDDDELREVFGTTTPTAADLSNRGSNLYDRLQRGECAYVVVYDDSRPSQFVFYGYSWD